MGVEDRQPFGWLSLRSGGTGQQGKRDDQSGHAHGISPSSNHCASTQPYLGEARAGRPAAFVYRLFTIAARGYRRF
jgi:hypothetical protein